MMGPSGRRAVVTAVAALCGTGVWVVTMASAPRYSYGNHEDMGQSGAYFAVLLVGAAVVGWLVPHWPVVPALALGLPGFMLSPWTAPRGDDDGLWLLIVPTLFVFVGVLVLVAVVVASVHVWLDDRDARDRPPKLRR